MYRPLDLEKFSDFPLYEYIYIYIEALGPKKFLASSLYIGFETKKNSELSPSFKSVGKVRVVAP